MYSTITTLVNKTKNSVNKCVAAPHIIGFFISLRSQVCRSIWGFPGKQEVQNVRDFGIIPGRVPVGPNTSVTYPKSVENS